MICASKCAFKQQVKVSFLQYSVIILYIFNSCPYLILSLAYKDKSNYGKRFAGTSVIYDKISRTL